MQPDQNPNSLFKCLQNNKVLSNHINPTTGSHAQRQSIVFFFLKVTMATNCQYTNQIKILIAFLMLPKQQSIIELYQSYSWLYFPQVLGDHNFKQN